DAVDALVGAVAHALVAIELLREGVDRQLVLRRLFGNATGAEIADGLRLDALLLGDRCVRRPLIVGFPVVRRDQDGELGEPWRNAGPEPAMSAELLGKLAEAWRMQIAVERPAHLELAARARTDRRHQRLLLGREALLRDEGQADRRHGSDGL